MKLKEITKEKLKELAALKDENKIRSAIEDDIELDIDSLDGVSGGTGNSEPYCLDCIVCHKSVTGITPEETLQNCLTHLVAAHPEQLDALDEFIKLFI